MRAACAGSRASPRCRSAPASAGPSGRRRAAAAAASATASAPVAASPTTSMPSAARRAAARSPSRKTRVVVGDQHPHGLGAHGSTQRQLGAHRRAAGEAALDAQAAAELGGALAHRRQARRPGDAAVEPAAVVARPPRTARPSTASRTVQRARSGVPRDVGEGLGGDAVGGDLDGRRQGGEGLRRVDADLRGRRRAELLGVLRAGPRPGRARRARAGAGRRRGGAPRRGPCASPRTPLGQRARRGGVAGEQRARRVDLEREPGERRPEPVVQVAAQAAALLLARRARAARGSAAARR